MKFSVGRNILGDKVSWAQVIEVESERDCCVITLRGLNGELERRLVGIPRPEETDDEDEMFAPLEKYPKFVELVTEVLTAFVGMPQFGNTLRIDRLKGTGATVNLMSDTDEDDYEETDEDLMVIDLSPLPGEEVSAPTFFEWLLTSE